MRSRRPAAAAIAFLAGFGVMVLELSAVRVLAPSFGDSAPVWTNVIGVILVGLAVGAALGGRLADRGGARWLPGLLLAAAGLTALVPWLAPRAAQWILPEALPLERALPALIEASLGVGVLAFVPPVLLLGAVSPMLIGLLGHDDAEHVGSVSGTIYAAGTIGSLVGTFAATHWLVPGLGLRGTFAVAAGAHVIAAILAMRCLAGQRPQASLIVLLAAGSLAAAEPTPVWLKEGERVLATVDSRYQRLWVVEGHEAFGGDAGRKHHELKINEGLDSYHSVRIEGRALTNGRYYDAFGMLAPLLSGDAAVRVLSLGCATGSILRVLRACSAKPIDAVAVDLDPEVLRLGREHFGMSPAEQQLVGLDARVYVERIEPSKRFDLVVIDTYRNQFYLPAHLTSREFFESVAKRVADDGLVALNVGDFEHGGVVLSAVAGTLRLVFDRVECLRVPSSRNFLVVASKSEQPIAELLAQRRKPDLIQDSWWRLATDSAAWRAHAEASEPLSDNWSNLQLLHERIYSRIHARSSQ